MKVSSWDGFLAGAVSFRGWVSSFYITHRESGKNHLPVSVKVSEHPLRLQCVMLLPLVSLGSGSPGG